MKKFIILYIFITLYSLLNADTIFVSGDVSGIWSADTVKVIGDLTIPDGEALTIDPGTYIEFQGHYKFNVQGQILAVGNEQDSIYFTAINHDEGWHGIRFKNTPVLNDSSKFYYCSFEYGRATGTELDDRSGGALYFKNYSKVHIANSTIYNNFATLGAGICCSYYSSPLIEFNDISNNSAGGVNPGDGAGAGIYMIYNSSPMIQNNIISNNTAYGTAGILCQNDSNPRIINNSISENGGLMYVGIGIFSSDPLLINNLIANNYAEFIGGGITCASYFSPVMINNTIVNNYACNGGGIVCGIDSTPQLINNIIWDNSAADGDQVYLMGETSDPDFYHCNVQGGISEFGGDGAAGFNGDYENCIDSDPLFLETGEHPYSLSDDSPCVNAGTPDTTGLNLPEFDLAGNPRIFGGKIDMGAYENQNVVVSSEENFIPQLTKLQQNYPNPFNPSGAGHSPETTISFNLTAENAENAELIIYNVRGQKVKTLVNEVLSSGAHSVTWNGRDSNENRVSSGIYFYQLKAGDLQKVKKMILLK